MLKFLKLSLKDLADGRVARYTNQASVDTAKAIANHCGITYHPASHKELVAIEWPETPTGQLYDIGFVDQHDAILIPVFASDVNTGRAMGRFYGFPECCIDYFANRTMEAVMADNATEFVLRGTGFIACPHCRANKTAEQLTAEIQQNRKCAAAFPDGEMDGNLNFVHYLFDTYVKGDSK